MGALTLRILVCGQIILFLSVVNVLTNAQLNIKPISSGNTTDLPLKQENQTSNSSSHFNNLTTQATPKFSVSVTGPKNQTNSTETPTTQSTTSSTTTTSSTVTSSTKSAQSSNGTASPSTTTVTKPEIITSAVTQTNTASFNESQGCGLNHSEKSLTILFSVLLGVILLVILGYFVYKFGRSNERSIQYTHRRLQNEDTGEPFSVEDDTLVISGGLYDGPQIYNPTVTMQNEEEIQTDVPGFVARPTQFRLEFLREDQESATFQTFRAHDQES